MAGAGWRDFVPGEVLTAANVQDYLQDQAVMTFASSAARSSALASPTEGMVSYRTDANIVEIYDGSAWKQFGATTGGILQVVNATSSGILSTNSTTYQDTNLTASITPKSTSSKILVLVTQYIKTGTGVAGQNLGAGFKLFSGATNINGQDQTDIYLTLPAGATYATSYSINHLDSPATTSAVTYKTQFACNASTLWKVNANANDVHHPGSITLIEVAG